MEKYKTIVRFKDLEDGGYVYNVGDTFPAEGHKKPSAARLKALASTENRRGRVLIEKLDEKPDKGKAKPADNKPAEDKETAEADDKKATAEKPAKAEQKDKE